MIRLKKKRKDCYIVPVGDKQWLLNVFDAWIIQEIPSKTVEETSLDLFFFQIIFFT